MSCPGPIPPRSIPARMATAPRRARRPGLDKRPRCARCSGSAWACVIYFLLSVFCFSLPRVALGDLLFAPHLPQMLRLPNRSIWPKPPVSSHMLQMLKFPLTPSAFLLFAPASRLGRPAFRPPTCPRCSRSPSYPSGPQPSFPARCARCSGSTWASSAFCFPRSAFYFVTSSSPPNFGLDSLVLPIKRDTARWVCQRRGAYYTRV